MAIDQVAARIGRTPEARVRWLLRFVVRDLGRLSPPARRAAWDGLFALQSRQPVRMPLRQETLAATQQTLREAITAFANGLPYELVVPRITWLLLPPVRRPTGARFSAPITRESVEAKRQPDAMPSAVVTAFVDDLNRIGADRLRACPFESRDAANPLALLRDRIVGFEGPDGESLVDERRCGQVFLATRGQRFCTRRHAQAAAWQTYASTHAVERKLRRR